MRRTKYIYAITAIMIVIWGAFFYKFHPFYNEMLVKVIDETSSVIKLLLLLTTNPASIIKFSLLFFFLLEIHLFFINFIYFKLKNSFLRNQGKKIVLAINVLILLIAVILLLRTIFTLIVIPIIVVGMTIAILSYIVLRLKYGRIIKIKENILGTHGPFTSEAECYQYIQDIQIDADNLKLIERKIFSKENKYYVEYLQNRGTLK